MLHDKQNYNFKLYNNREKYSHFILKLKSTRKNLLVYYEPNMKKLHM